MKKITVFLLINFLVFLSGSAWALTITMDSDTIDVGVADTLIASTDQKLSGDTAEFNWVKSILGDDIIFSSKYDEVTASDWYLTDAAGTWAFNFSDSPDYFLVKTGDIEGSNTRDFLFQNNVSLDWAVVNLGDLGVTDVVNIGKISHLSNFDTTTSPVPEPATMILLGSGLLGFGFFGRKKASR